MKMKLGVLSLQRALPRYGKFLSELDCELVEVKKREDLIDIKGLIIYGKEYPSDYHLDDGLRDRIKELAALDFPIFGICAGMVLLSKESYILETQLELMDIRVANEQIIGKREVYLSIPALGIDPVKAILNNKFFIEEITPNVGILAEYNGKIVFVRQGNMLASAFYPEQTSADRINRYFLDIVNGQI